MKLLLCSVMDSRVGAYASPFCARTKGEAIRSFEDACKDPNMPFGKHPSDFRLWIIGEFDDNSAHIVSIIEPLIGADEFG